MSDLGNVVRDAFRSTATLLARFGLIDERRGARTADIAWPRVVTGLARRGQSTADLAMVGLAIGPAAIAGLGFAFAIWMVVNSLGWSLASGSMTFLSQRYGADDVEGLDLAVKQTLWIELAMGVVFTAVLVSFARPMIGALGASGAALDYGAIYLQVVALALTFELVNKVPSRTLLSANDAWTPMVVRASGGFLNIALNGYLIFVLDLGVLGAAVGTVLATVAVTVALMAGLLRGQLPWIGELPVRIRAGPPYFDLRLTTQLLEVSLPVMGKQLVMRGSQFLVLALVASFGTLVVAAYATAREIRELLNTPAWGFSTAARSLVGQELGTGDDAEAAAYGRDILTFTAVVFACLAALTVVFAGPMAQVFTRDARTVELAVPFIRVTGISLLALGLDSALEGVIGAAGDTRWPLYGQLLGLYGFMLPIAYAGTVTPLGVYGLYLALVAETGVPALVTYYRYRTDRWKTIARRYHPGATE